MCDLTAPLVTKQRDENIMIEWCSKIAGQEVRKGESLAADGQAVFNTILGEECAVVVRQACPLLRVCDCRPLTAQLRLNLVLHHPRSPAHTHAHTGETDIYVQMGIQAHTHTGYYCSLCLAVMMGNVLGTIENFLIQRELWIREGNKLCD